MRSVAILASLCLFGSCANAETISTFKIGEWSAGAYSVDGTQTFSHCAASGNYLSGTTALFSVTSGYKWSMGFGNPAWQLTKGAQYDIAFSIDGAPTISAKAFAILPNVVQVPLEGNIQLFQKFVRGYQLTVTAAGQTFQFNLTNTAQLLPALVTCVQQYTGIPAPEGTIPRANPFVATGPSLPSAPPSNGPRANPFVPSPPNGPNVASTTPSDAANKAEALGVAANILSSAGMSGFRFVTPEPTSHVDAIWVGENNSTIGTIKIETQMDRALLGGTTIGVDAASCKSKFASGAMPSADGVTRLFTKCGEGKDTTTIFYFLLPRRAGGFYVVGVGAVGSDEPARQAESNIRQAAFNIIGNSR